MHGGHHEHHHHHHLRHKKPEPWTPPPQRQTRLGLARVDRRAFWGVIVPIAVIIWAVGVVHNWG